MAGTPNIPIWPLLEGLELRAERFWEKVDRRGPDECWLWLASRTTRGGYGRFKITGTTMVHSNRVAWALEHRCDPGPMIIRHRCDNPPCCNPAHLEIGTVADNNRDKMERGRFRPGKQDGEHNGAAKLTMADVSGIVSGLKAGLNNKQIAARYPVGHALVSRIRTGRSWLKEARGLGWEPKAQFIRRSLSPTPGAS